MLWKIIKTRVITEKSFDWFFELFSFLEKISWNTPLRRIESDNHRNEQFFIGKKISNIHPLKLSVSKKMRLHSRHKIFKIRFQIFYDFFENMISKHVSMTKVRSSLIEIKMNDGQIWTSLNESFIVKRRNYQHNIFPWQLC